MENALSIYFNEITDIPVLTKEQEKELGFKIKEGDEEAREKMIRSNLKLVVKIARAYENMGLPLLDLISEGNIGLIAAAEKFDPEKYDNKFSSYACWLIKNKIRPALLNKSRTIRLPSYIGSQMSRIYRTKEDLFLKLQREPSVAEIAKEIGMSEESVNALFEFNSTTSLEELSSGGFEPVEESKENEISEGLEFSEVSSKIKQLVSELSERDSTIISFRFGLNGNPVLSLAQVGEKFGVSRERIRQIQNQVFKKLKKQCMELV